ncbi:SH3 domain-containing protein [Paludibaculum fermentans]|uniref:Uncharacterized protein n=1 Tax=Paludibaculum fermentans TaxID=1473598 RepID=A0A7S7NP13_PALFE|nr:hypothetical protein [Paludibaculum fermentans]QOY87162.1 hypothetical protein IRI77_31020 [Paludibaculum fermentans]
MRRLGLVVFFSLAGALYAQDPQLEALRTTLATMRAQTRGAGFDTPVPAAAMTKVKQQLRDWIESKLAAVQDDEAIPALEAQLNQELQSIAVANEEPQESRFGTLGEVSIRLESGNITLTTSVGILCQNDDSAYVYQKKAGRWQRIWASEQQGYSEEGYKPQVLIQVDVWQQRTPGQGDGPIYVMTLGNQWGCASTWHPVYYRVWRVNSSGSKLLIDGDQTAWMRTGTYAVGRIGQKPLVNKAPVDVLIEFTVASVDSGVHNREAVLHFLIDGDKVRRVAPVALSPRDFVDEWLTHDWQESGGWSASEVVHPWHRKLHAERVDGTFRGTTKRCQTPGLWQVAFAPNDEHANYADQKPLYFLVQWRPPYHFTMKEVRAEPWRGCTQEAPEADEWRGVFSTPQQPQ